MTSQASKALLLQIGTKWLPRTSRKFHPGFVWIALSLSLSIFSLPLSPFVSLSFSFFILSLTLSVSCRASSETPIQLIFLPISVYLWYSYFQFFLSLYRPCSIGAHRPSKRQTFAFLSLGLQIFCESQHEVSKANQKQVNAKRIYC